MKFFTSISRIKRYTIILGMVLLVPLAYAATQASFLQPSTLFTSPETNPLAKEYELKPLFSSTEQVKKGLIEGINKEQGSFVLRTGTTSLVIEIVKDTIVATGKENIVLFSALENNTKVYVFGFMKSDKTSLLASKIIIVNRSVLERVR
ncbi:MAG: hypothetical protein WC444_00980 [Candidatus Paceibacterota bacterium]